MKGLVSGIKAHFELALSVVGSVLSAPFRAMKGAAVTAFNAIARAWNNTVGSLSFEVPGWVPGLGGKGWDVPDLPTVSARSMAAPTVLNLPAGTDGYSLVATLRTFERTGGSTDLARVAVA